LHTIVGFVRVKRAVVNVQFGIRNSANGCPNKSTVGGVVEKSRVCYIYLFNTLRRKRETREERGEEGQRINRDLKKYL
jgi:hypothetical protein